MLICWLLHIRMLLPYHIVGYSCMMHTFYMLFSSRSCTSSLYNYMISYAMGYFAALQAGSLDLNITVD